MEMKLEIHPYNLTELIPPGTRMLIVGTAPPPRFSFPRGTDWSDLEDPRDTDFYYGSLRNNMWKFLDVVQDDVDGEKLLALDPLRRRDKMRDFLRRHGIWMKDVLQTYNRKPGKKLGKEPSASDADFGEKTFTDFRPIFAANKNLTTVAFTSEKAAEWTFEALGQQTLLPLEQFKAAQSKRKVTKKTSGIKVFEQPLLSASVGDRELIFYVLPTPANFAGRMKGLTSAIKKQTYRQVLFQDARDSGSS